MARKKVAKAKLPQWRVVIMGAILLIALGVGLLAAFKGGAAQQLASMPVNATGRQLEADRAQIIDAYLAKAAKCSPGSTESAAQATTNFYKYLRVNIHGDRAVIRGCGNADQLLAKIGGKWQTTDVNMNLDASANPSWQRACDIADITRADTKVRPENTSIDAFNLKLCQGLQQGKNLRMQDL